MTHITEERVIGNHADMGGSTTVATRTSLTVTDILRAGVRRGRASPMISAYVVMLAIMRVATDMLGAANDRIHLLTDSLDEHDH